jgi:hypothetical protein
MRTITAILFVAVVLSAAASAATWPGPPAAPPPRVQGTSGPPPAWLETRTRSLWLAFSSFCWRTVCADYLPPQSRTDLPVLRIRRGTLVRFHFAFAPTQLKVTTFVGTTSKRQPLAPARTVQWRPRQAGVVSFDTRGALGSASYVVRLRLS